MNTNTINMEIHREPNQTRVCILLKIEILLSSLNIVEVTNIFFDSFKEMALKSLGEFLSLLDTLMIFKKEKVSSTENKRCRGNKKEREICKFYDEKLKTSLGEVPFRCREIKKDGKYSIPLREVIGMPPRKQVVEGTFEDAVKTCALAPSFLKAWEITDKVISKSKLWHMFQEYAKKKREDEERAIDFFSQGDITQTPAAGDTACGTIDEIWVRRALSPEERERYEKEWEKKEQERMKREKETGKCEKKTKKKKSGWLKVKCSLVKVKSRMKTGWNRILSYVSCCGAEEYIKRARDYFNCHLGLHNIPHFFCISDADSLGKNFSKLYEHCIWILDRWHLWEYIKKLGTFSRDVMDNVWELVKGENVEEALKKASGLFEEVKSYMKTMLEGNTTKGLLGSLNHLSSIKDREKSWWKKRVEELEGIITYIGNNRDGIENCAKLRQFLPEDEMILGSGSIENLQKVMIGYRMKGHGRIWGSGAGNMAFLLCKFFNDEEERQKIAELLLLADELKEMEKIVALSPVQKVARKRDNSRPASFPGYRMGKRSSTLYKIGRSIQRSGFIGNVA